MAKTTKKVKYPDTMYVSINNDGYQDCSDQVGFLVDGIKPTKMGEYELVRIITVTPKFEISE